MTITNTAPRVTSNPPSLSMIHGTALSMPLTAYFVDDEGDPITMTATYSLNGGASVAIPGGIFTVPGLLTIDVISTGLADVGLYTIYLSLSDT